MQSYGAVQGYQSMPTETYPEYLSLLPMPVTPPSITHFGEAYLGGSMDEAIPPYMSYGGYPIPGVDQGVMDVDAHKPWIPDFKDSFPWRWKL